MRFATIFVTAMLVGLTSMACAAEATGEGLPESRPTVSPAFIKLVVQVLDEHPGIQAASAALDAAQARGRAADRPLYNPELELDAERAELDTAYLGISQSIDWADKRGARANIGALAAQSEQAGLVLDQCFVTGFFQSLADIRRAPILPDNRLVNQAARGAFPDKRCLPLVGDADGVHRAGSGKGFFTHRDDRGPDLLPIMFHLAGLGKVLREFLLGAGQDPAPGIEDHGATAGGALIDSQYGKVLFHGGSDVGNEIGQCNAWRTHP